MKTRATSVLLATLAVVSFVLPALAAASDGSIPEEPPVEIVEIEEVESAILLDGESVPTVEYEILDGVCYVTVSSFVSMLDAEAMVEEEGGVVRVYASTSTVTEVAPLDPNMENAWVPDGEESVGYTTGEEVPEYPYHGVEPVTDVTVEDTGDITGQEWTGYAADVVDTGYAADVVTADLNLTAAIGGTYFVANDRYLYAGNGLVELNGRVAAPVRLLARVFNLAVAYDTVDDQVLLSHQEGAEPYLTSGGMAYDGDTLYWLSRIIHAESGNQPLEGKIAVGNVVMNRVNDPRFPDTIYEVLFQKNQFSPAASGSIYRDPNWESVVAAKLVMDGAQVLPDALFFNIAGARTYAARTRDYVATIGDHAFYK